MATITLQIPDSLEKERDDIVRFIAAKLYEAGRLSLGQAAETCGMNKWDFPAVLVKFNVAFFQYTMEEIAAEVDRVNNRL